VLDLLGKIEAAELPDGRYIVTARGPLDSRVAPTLRDKLLPLAAAENPVVLDLEEAHGLDNDALAVIARAAHLVRKRGDSMVIVSRRPSVLQLVSSCGLDDIVVLQPTLKEVLPL
jgi:anti-anti-sigma factor